MFKPLFLVGVALSVVLAGASRHPVLAVPPEVEQLIKQLADPDESVRLKAAKELGKLKEKAKDAIPALTKAAKDTDEDVRTVAKRSLAAIKEAVGEKVDVAKIDERLVPLIKDMKSKDNKVRLATIAKLEELGAEAKPAGAAIVEFGIMSSNDPVKVAAINAFEKIDPTISKEVITVLFDGDLNKRILAAKNLASMGEKAKAAIPAIKVCHQTLWNNFKQTPAATLQALVMIDPEDEAVQRLILDLVGGPDSTVPQVRFGNKTAVPSRHFLVQLMNQMNIPDQKKITPLVLGIAQCRGTGQGIELPEDVFIRGQRERLFMLAELGKLEIETKQKYTALMSVLAKNTTERAQIINEVAKLGADAKAALPILMALKADRDEAVRIAANAAIAAIKE